MVELVSLVGSLIFLALVLLGVVGLGLWFSYNTLQTDSQAVRKHHASIAAAARTKTDLVRQLFEITKEYGAHEQLVHSVVARVDDQPGGPVVPVGNVAGVVSQMVRAYPDLKANDNYKMLMKQLEDVEVNILHRRDLFNEAANRYNTRRSQLPHVLIAGPMGFEEAPYFSDVQEDVLELFKSDSGEILRATLADFTRTVGETSKRLGTDLGQRGRQLAEYGRARLDRRLESGGTPEHAGGADGRDERDDGGGG